MIKSKYKSNCSGDLCSAFEHIRVQKQRKGDHEAYPQQNKELQCLIEKLNFLMRFISSIGLLFDKSVYKATI